MSYRYFSLLLTAFILSLAWSPTAHAQVDWTHFSTEAVLYADPVEEEWSEGAVWAPTVIRAEGDTLKMWYSGGANIFFDSQIGYAWSLDGVSWTRHQDNPVLLPEGNAPFAWMPHVLLDGDILHMWYAEGSFINLDFVIRYATSADGGVTWDRYPQPVLEPGPAGTWNEAAVRPGDVIKEDGLFKMWFTGGTGEWAPPGPTTAHSIGYATSPDGIAWTVYDDPATTDPPFHLSDPVVLHGPVGTFDHLWAQGATVRRTDAGYELWYDGADGNVGAIGYATSPDGIEWTKDAGNPVLTILGAPLATDVFFPSVLFYDGQYHMWLSLYYHVGQTAYSNIGYATAPVTPVAVEPGTVPLGALALDAYPNPFRSTTEVAFELAEDARVRLVVYDVLGREVAVLADGAFAAARHEVVFDASGLPSGTYVVRVSGERFSDNLSVTLLK